MEKKISEIIKEKKAEGEAVINTAGGLRSIKVGDFIKQHTDGLLYDLNMLFEVGISFVDEDVTHVNRCATALVIKALKDKIDELEKLIKADE